MGLNGAKYSYEVPEWFAQHPGHFWDGYFLATLLYYWNISQIWQNNVFDEIVHAIKWFSKAPWAKWPEEAWEHFMLLVKNYVCYGKNKLNLHLRGGSPYFPIWCLINSIFHEQLFRQSVLIFFIYASIRYKRTQPIPLAWDHQELAHTPNDPPRRVSMNGASFSQSYGNICWVFDQHVWKPSLLDEMWLGGILCDNSQVWP